MVGPGTSDGLLLTAAMFLVVGAAICGASVAGAEWRAGTITTVLTWEPSRLRLHAARTASAAILAFVIGFALQVVFLASPLPAVVLNGDIRRDHRRVVGRTGAGDDADLRSITVARRRARGEHRDHRPQHERGARSRMAAWALVVERIVAGLRPQLARFMIGENVATVIPWSPLTDVEFERPPIVALAAPCSHTRGGGCCRRPSPSPAGMSSPCDHDPCEHAGVWMSAGVRLRDALRAWCAVADAIPALAASAGEVSADGSRHDGGDGTAARRGPVRRRHVPRRGHRRWCASPGCSSTTATPPRISSRRPSSVLPAALDVSRTRPGHRPISGRSCSTWPATTTAVGSCRCATARRSTTSSAGVDDEIDVREDQRQVLDALRDLPRRQRACLVLRYYDELGIDDIATTLGVSRNSVKTHLQRGLAALEAPPDCRPRGRLVSALEERLREALHDRCR